jgi:hypothetical protein
LTCWIMEGLPFIQPNGLFDGIWAEYEVVSSVSVMPCSRGQTYPSSPLESWAGQSDTAASCPAFYFSLALFVSRAFATKASNRGSL